MVDQKYVLPDKNTGKVSRVYNQKYRTVLEKKYVTKVSVYHYT